MEPLSNEMCAAVGLTPGATATELLGHASAIAYDALDGLVATEQARIDVEQSFVLRDAYNLLVVPQVGLIQERYCVVQVDDLPNPVLVGMVSNEIALNLPTALENLIFWALVDPALPWHAQWRETSSGLVSEWRQLACGHAIVATPVGMCPESLRVVSAIFGLQHSEVHAPLPLSPLAVQAAAISITAPSSRISLVQARLISQASSVTHPKWRCLSLYRILENAYLNNIKKILLAEFDIDAGKALDDAKKKVVSEPNQLIALADEADLKTEFELLDAEFERLLASGNQFIIRLDKAAESELLYRAPERYKKAVIRFYKLRCAIAHAGTSSVIYEQFPDADQAVMAMLPFIEVIALKSLKISM